MWLIEGRLLKELKNETMGYAWNKLQPSSVQNRSAILERGETQWIVQTGITAQTFRQPSLRERKTVHAFSQSLLEMKWKCLSDCLFQKVTKIVHCSRPFSNVETLFDVATSTFFIKARRHVETAPPFVAASSSLTETKTSVQALLVKNQSFRNTCRIENNLILKAKHFSLWPWLW